MFSGQPLIRFAIVTTLLLAREILSGNLNVKRVNLKKGIYLLLHFPEHINVLRIFNHPSIKNLLIEHPKLVYKYLDQYASLNLSTESRQALLLAHYEFVQARLAAPFLSLIASSKIEVWNRRSGEENISIELDFPATFHAEGDLCLTLQSNGKPIYRIALIIGHGGVFSLDRDDVIFISCVQGLIQLSRVNEVTSACGDIHPTHLLMAAVAGIADAFQIRSALGVRTRNQIANKGKFYFSYDAFFENYGCLLPDESAYIIQLPFPQKDLATIKSNHRNRTRQKRDIRRNVGINVSTCISRYVAASGPNRIAHTVEVSEPP